MKVIAYVMNNTDGFIRKDGNEYVSCDGMYKLVEYKGNSSEHIKEIVDAESAKINIVIVSDYEMAADAVAYLKSFGASIFDSKQLSEVQYNIEMFRHGKNIPSYGPDKFKSRLTHEIKEKINNNVYSSIG